MRFFISFPRSIMYYNILSLFLIHDNLVSNRKLLSVFRQEQYETVNINMNIRIIGKEYRYEKHA